MELFAWLKLEAAKLRLPTCQRNFFPPSLDAESAEYLRRHVNHWLATDEWPVMEELDEAWAHVFLEFALHELMDACKKGYPQPRTLLEIKGVLQGILQKRRWPAAADSWLELFLKIRRSQIGHQN